MRKIFLLIIMVFIATPIFAGTKLISGSFLEMRKEKNIPVILDWSVAIYGKNGTLDDFINKARRSSNWETASLSYFINEFNKRTGEYGVSITLPENNVECPYTLIIKTSSISKGGDIKGIIFLLKNDSSTPLGIAEFSSDESDDDDEIAFKDQLENIGENFGKLVQKELKKYMKK